METMNVARSANKYFNDAEPWKSIKANPEEAAKTLYVCSQVLYALSIAFAPIIPHTAKILPLHADRNPRREITPQSESITGIGLRNLSLNVDSISRNLRFYSQNSKILSSKRKYNPWNKLKIPLKN
jgi:hypothetical protein